MATFKIYRETALPGTLQAYAMYIIAPAGLPNYVEIYVTGASASTVKRVPLTTDIQAMIDASVAAVSQLTIVADIAARNALSPTGPVYVFVRNATGDGTVASGGATYLYDLANTAWLKVSESESMDVALTWAALSGKPTSSPTDLDNAVTLRHSHTNKTQLDKIGEASGELTYDGNPVTTHWTTTGW